MTEPQFLVPQDVYLKAGISIGTKFKTKYMEKFIYKTRPDGLSVLNLQQIDARLVNAANLLSHYAPDEILICGRRENAWKPVKLFSELTGVAIFPGRYPPGTLTNPKLKTYMDKKLLLVVDAWPDGNAVKDAIKVGIPIIGLCDTNNQSNNLDLIVPCNNKGKRSLGLIFYILAREYLMKHEKIKDEKEMKYSMDDFMGE